MFDYEEVGRLEKLVAEIKRLRKSEEFLREVWKPYHNSWEVPDDLRFKTNDHLGFDDSE